MRRLAAIVAVMLVPSQAWAYRPFDSTDAAVAERGELELEIGPVGYIHADGRRQFAPLQIINLGFIKGWELVLQGREVLPPEKSGASPRIGLVDTGVFFKGVLRDGSLQDKTGVSVAAEVGPLLPTVNGDPGMGFSGALIISNRFSFGTFHLNVQGARTRAGNDDLFTGLIAEGPYTWRARPVVEVFSEREFNAHTTWSALGGIIVRVTHEFALDAGFRVASIDRTALYEARAGFTWAISVWE